VASQLVLASALQRWGKRAVPINAGPFDRQEIISYRERFLIPVESEELPAHDAIIIVDCPGRSRVGPILSELIGTTPLLVIDHHPPEGEKEAIRFVRTNQPAAVILIYQIMMALEISLTPEEAQLLFLGLATDTGFFHFLDASHSETFGVAAALTSAGANPRKIAREISANRSMDSRMVLARMLSRVEKIQGGTFLITWKTKADEVEFPGPGDSAALHHLLLTVEGVQAIAVVREKEDGCSISLRSASEIDVSRIARQFNGGGHTKAAGAFTQLPLLEVLSKLRDALEATLPM
jgi:phosphoesterase RecJ-like protein